MAIGPEPRTIALGSPNQEMSGALPATETVTVVGEECFGSEQPRLREFAQQLARQADVPLLRARFTRRMRESVFIDADLAPTLDDPGVEDAVLRCLGGSGAAQAKGAP